MSAVDPLERLGGVPGVLGSILEGRDLSVDDAEIIMDRVFDGQADPIQVAGLLIALRAKGETADELTGMVRSMLSHATAVELAHPAMDIVGTGGDGLHSVNVSTMAALVVAGAGVPVCKHGNRAASSMVGTADVLEKLGVRIDLSPSQVAAAVEAAGIGFCFAQAFHPAMRFVGPVRAALGVRTAFNLLGPLANPSRPRRLLVGTADGATAEKMATVLGANGVERAWIVHSHDGFDELSLSAASDVVEVTGDGMGDFDLRHWVLDPRSAGFESAEIDAVRGGDASFNAAVVRDLLSGARGPVRDFVLLNAAAALVIAEAVDSIEAGAELAATSIDSGDAASCLDRLIESTTSGLR